jgi:hypothetical protein
MRTGHSARRAAALFALAFIVATASMFFGFPITESSAATPPTTLGTSASSSPLCCSFQRKTFHAEGLFWLFYSDGSGIGCVTSPDGVNWSSETLIASSAPNGSLWSTWYNYSSDTLYYARAALGAFYYRYGSLSSAGCNSISWAIPETAQAPSNNGTENNVFISAASNADIWVSLSTTDTHGFVHLEVWKYNGTWTETKDVNTSSPSPEGGAIIPLSSDQKWAFAYGTANAAGKISIVTTSDGGQSWSNPVQTVDSAASFLESSEVATGDTLVIVYPASNTIEYVDYPLGGSISPRVTVDTITGTVLGANLSINSTDGDLVATYANSTAIFYKVSQTITSPNWSAPVEEAGSNKGVSSDSSILPGPTSTMSIDSNESVTAWANGTSPPYSLRFVSSSLDVVQPISLSPLGSKGATTPVWSVSGCGAAPSQIAGDGAPHDIMVWPGCAFAIYPPQFSPGVRYPLANNTPNWTIVSCRVATCSSAKNSYYVQYYVALYPSTSVTYTSFGSTHTSDSVQGVWSDSGSKVSLGGTFSSFNWTISSPSWLYVTNGLQIFSNASLSSFAWNSTGDTLRFVAASSAFVRIYFAPSSELVPVGQWLNGAVLTAPTISENVIGFNGSGSFQVQFQNASCSSCQTSQIRSTETTTTSANRQASSSFLALLGERNTLVPLGAVSAGVLGAAGYFFYRQRRRYRFS